MTSLLAVSHTPGMTVLLVITIKLKAKYIFYTAVILFYVLQEMVP